jgi:nucleoside-diphosphate-sugar epimerase
MAHLVIPGGNGFIGSHIARLAAEHGHDVTAFGRSGAPDLDPDSHAWMRDVRWRAADVFDLDTWRDALASADAVIHSIATIRQDPKQDRTFDRLNAESALRAAEAADEAGVGAFVFLSVRNKPPFVSGRFIAAKRRAEREIPQAYPDLRFVSLRPNLVFGPGRRGSATLAALLETAQPWTRFSYATPGGRPLPVELVAAAAVHAAVTPSVEGTLSVPQIDEFGRTSGLVGMDEVTEPSLVPFLLGVGGAALGGWLLRRAFRS